jgi:hypothetical protein
MMVRISGVVHDWCWQPGYADRKTGIPRAVPLDGDTFSLRELIARRFPDKNTEDVLAWMEANGVVARQLDGTFTLTRRSVVVGDSRALALERMVTLATEFLQTGLHNLKKAENEERRPDRISRVFHLPEKYRSQFRELVNEQMQAFLETVDSWLESRNDPNSAEPCVEAGVHSYVFIAPARRHPSAVLSKPQRRK